MKPQFDIAKIDSYDTNQQLPLECEFCNQIFYARCTNLKSIVNRLLNEFRFCNSKCFGQAITNISKVFCNQCSTQFCIKLSQKKKSKTGNHFCSKSCAAKFNNTHKTKGNRRSKLEIWLEQQLKTIYPNLEIIFNNKNVINSELDIYIPSLNLAFELNGIFHYEPIYGSEKLASIQNNDNRKFQACLEQAIELVIIDSSGLNYFKPDKAQKYLDIITKIISG